VTAPVLEAAPGVDASVSTAGESGGAISAPMVAALEGAWAAIRSRHPEVPAVVMVLGAGSIGATGGALKPGHFAAMRWADPDQPATGDGDGAGAAVRLPEVFVGGEGLARGPANVLGTLLHEAAHALAHIRGIKDTSRQGLAQRAVQGAGRGTRDRGRQALPHRLVPDHPPGGHPRRLRRGDRRAGAGAAAAPVGGDYRRREDEDAEAAMRVRVRATNPRVAPSALVAGPITCGPCGTDF
jgi:hypothetical protein